MGVCLSSCVQCAAYIHDKYTDWRWDDDDDFSPMDHIHNRAPHPNKTIHSAVIDKNVDEIRRLLNDEDIARNKQNSAGETALHMACKLGYKTIIDELLDCGCSADITTNVGTPIHCIMKAVKAKYISEAECVVVIHKLVNFGCDIDARDKGFKSALFCAAEQGLYSCMEALIELGANLNRQEANDFSALYMAVIRGDLKCVELLLAQKDRIDVNLKDTTGRTPLLAALITITNNFRYERLPNDIYNYDVAPENVLTVHRYNRIAIVESLLRAGANPNTVDNHGRSALVLAFIILELDNIHNSVSSDKCVYCLHRGQNGVISCTYGIREDSTDGRELETCFSNSNTTPESIYTPLVRLLILYGARFPERWEKNYSHSPVWLQQLYEQAQNAWTDQIVVKVPSLVHLCRVSIRSHLGNIRKLHLIDQLPLPGKLQNFVMITYL